MWSVPCDGSIIAPSSTGAWISWNYENAIDAKSIHHMQRVEPVHHHWTCWMCFPCPQCDWQVSVMMMTLMRGQVQSYKPPCGPVCRTSSFPLCQQQSNGRCDILYVAHIDRCDTQPELIVLWLLLNLICRTNLSIVAGIPISVKDHHSWSTNEINTNADKHHVDAISLRIHQTLQLWSIAKTHEHHNYPDKIRKYLQSNHKYFAVEGIDQSLTLLFQ